MLTDGSGNTVWRAENTAFDRRVVLDAIGGLNLGFPGPDESLRHDLQKRSCSTIGLAGGVNLYNYADGNPLSRSDPSGLGPWSFGICTVANAAYTTYSFYSTMKQLDSTRLAQDLLIRVNNEISQCPAGDTKRMEGLQEIKRDLVKILADPVARAASDANRFGVGDVALAAAFEGFCGLLLFSPLP